MVSTAADPDRVMPTTMRDEDRHTNAVIRAPSAFEVVQHERSRDLTPHESSPMSRIDSAGGRRGAGSGENLQR